VSQKAGALRLEQIKVPRHSTLESERLSAPLSKSLIWFTGGFYVVLTALTREVNQGDTPWYALSILNYAGGRDFLFWDFGHLVWRPGIWALLQVVHRFMPSANSISLLFGLMLSVNWIAGLGCVLLTAQVTRKFVSVPLAFLTASALSLSQVFLNYLHTGTAYVPGLFFLFLGLDLAASTNKAAQPLWRDSCVFGAALAIAVLLWLPLIFALPGLFLFPVVVNGFRRESTLYTLKAILFAAILGIGTYCLAASKLELYSVAEIRGWFISASHSIDHLGGLPRAAFGFVRSWLELGSVGIEFRRFLLHDPYAPVSLLSVLFAGTWMLFLTYLFLGAIVWKLLRGSPQDRRILLFLLLVGLPVFGFGIKWQGGDMERYVAAFPALLLAGACAMNSRPPTVLKILGITFLSALTIVNLSHDLRWVRNAEDRELMARLNSLGSLPESSYIVLFPADRLFGIISPSPTAPQGRANHAIASWIVTIGSSHVTEWRQTFAANSLMTWKNGKQVWICRGFLDGVPQRRWGWVEGIDPLVSWKDIYNFFAKLQISETRGDFVQIPPTQANIEQLQGFLLPPK
jgi:hypothetical protein